MTHVSVGMPVIHESGGAPAVVQLVENGKALCAWVDGDHVYRAWFPPAVLRMLCPVVENELAFAYDTPTIVDRP